MAKFKAYIFVGLLYFTVINESEIYIYRTVMLESLCKRREEDTPDKLPVNIQVGIHVYCSVEGL